MRENIISVAIDGPAGAGKTTIAQNLSKELGILYLNTGAMYRAAGFYALSRGVNPLDEEGVEKILPNLNIEIRYENGTQQTLVNSIDITSKLSEPEFSDAGSKISSLPAVRKKLVALQQELSKTRSLILDGRDIGTVVLPEAKFKFFLDAGVEVRAQRRHKEYLLKGNNISFEEVLEDIKERDFRDINRKTSPLKAAEDAIYIDCSDMTIEQVVNFMLNKIKG